MSPVFPDPQENAFLSREEIALAVSLLCNPELSEDPKGTFLSGLNQRGESAEELAGFAEELLAQARPVPIKRDGSHPLVELCGTGGDKAGLLNISTAAMFVAAGAGARVVKHGNRAVSSRCGSADVLEALGVNLHLEAPRIPEILEQAGCVFLLASDFHPTVARLGPLRRALAARGQMTIFNLLGPLLNPARPEVQLTGVYCSDLLVRYAAAMGLLGRRRAWAVHGEDGAGNGVDELSVTGRSFVVEYKEGEISPWEIRPEELGFVTRNSSEELLGGDAVQNAGRILEILSGNERGLARDMIVLNAAAALHLANRSATLAEGILLACESIDSGKALASLQALRAASLS